MQTFLVGSDNSLRATETQRILHRSSNVDNIRFLCAKQYVSDKTSYDMASFTCTLEYVLPISRKYVIETLTPADYESDTSYIQYTLPVTTAITSEPGDIVIKLTFTYLDATDPEKLVERVRKTTSTLLKVTPVEAWSDYVASTDLDAIARAMLTLQSKIDVTKAIANQIFDEKADNLVLDSDNSKLYLTAAGKQVGDAVDLNVLGDNVAEATREGLTKVII